MYEAAREILEGSDFSVVESFTIPGRPARFSDVPRFLFESSVGSYISSEFPAGIWTHQSDALAYLGRGDNVVISTGTASGKSLVFRALALHKTLLNPSSRTIVFYPQRALVEDQLRGWQEMARALGLDEDIIGRIDGTVRPMKRREEVLGRARIVVMTPDVCQAWLMARLAMPVVRNFISGLSTLVMDEAHTLEGVFGSNFAFLIRRLMAARNHMLINNRSAIPTQLVGATATIAQPDDHMKQLTGEDFTVVDHEADGAQRHERIVAHIACPEGEQLQIANQLQQHVLTNGRSGGFITFVDSRRAVETLAMDTDRDMNDLLDDPAVSSYRAGYTPEERRRIERDLRSGVLKGVVSTSALELGIDFPSLQVGFNVGIPPTRKAYRQRLGRVGRNAPGAFIIVAPPREFRQYGITLHEYHEMSVETSYLYLDNRFMQFAHGRCLSDEREALAAPGSLPSRIKWPSGFRGIYVSARPGGNRPPEFDFIAELGGDMPHRGYPLRNIGEPNFPIKQNENASPLGDVNLTRALRECYPGATYFHNMKPFYVTSWNTRTLQQPYIQAVPGYPGRSTIPRIRIWTNAEITSGGILDGHLLRGATGFLAECRMLITERVEGYTDSRTGEFYSYQDLQQKNPSMKSRSRNFRTSGVLLRIDEDWFKQRNTRHQFADILREVFIHEYSVSPQDIGSVATNVSVMDGNGRRWRGGCIAVFDETYGSLRFTERLYLAFDRILNRLAKAVQGQNDLVSIVAQVRQKVDDFIPASAFAVDIEDPPMGYEQVFKPGSRVCYRQTGAIAEDVEIIRATIMGGVLIYQVKAYTPPWEPPRRRWIPASNVEPSAESDAWEIGWWNVATEEFEDFPNEDGPE